MAAALTAFTESFHFAYTHLDNWTLVTDGDGVMRLGIDLGTKTRTHQSAS
jgi:hypothetical protein